MRITGMLSQQKALVFGILTGVLIAWWYFNPFAWLGMAMGAVAGLMVYLILRTGRIERFRRPYFVILFAVISLSLLGMVMFWGPDQFMKWVDRFNPGYYFPRSGGLGTISYPHPIVLPSIFWGGADFLAQFKTWQTSVPQNMAASFLFMLPYAVILLLFGRAFCGWLCPVGGLPEAMSSGCKEVLQLGLFKGKKAMDGSYYYTGLKPWVNIARYVVLLITVLVFLVSGFAVVNIFYPVLWLQSMNAFWIIIAITAVFAVVLPLLTKRRWWCFVCPLGTALSFIDRVTPFRLKIDRDKCVRCMDCVHACRMYAMTPQEVEKGREKTGHCIKCGRCIEACSEEAIDIYWMEGRRKIREPFIALIIATGLMLYIWYIIQFISLVSRMGDFRWLA